MIKVNALYRDRPIETLEDVFDMMDCATMALRSLLTRVSESQDTTMANDAEAVIGLYLSYTDRLIAKGNELAAALNQTA